MKFYSLELQIIFYGIGLEDTDVEYDFFFKEHKVKKISEFHMLYRCFFLTLKQDIFSLNKVFQNRCDFSVVFLDKRKTEKQKKRLLNKLKGLLK